MTNGREELRVPLQWTDDHGVTVTKTYVFRRGSYRIGLEYHVDNKSAENRANNRRVEIVVQPKAE